MPVDIPDRLCTKAICNQYLFKIVVLACAALVAYLIIRHLRKVKPSEAPAAPPAALPAPIFHPPQVLAKPSVVHSYGPTQNPERYSDNRSVPYSSGAISYASVSARPCADLDEGQFRKTVMANQEPALVMFHASWCGPCKATLPNFRQAALVSKRRFVAIEDSVAGDLKQQCQIKGFPTILKFEGGKPIDVYNGDRSVEDIARWASS